MRSDFSPGSFDRVLSFLSTDVGWIEHESGDLSLIDNSGTFPEVAPALEGSRLEGKLGQAMLTQFN
jgi:hypothetical protein